MAFRTVPGAIVVGSPTAGADGHVSKIPLPTSMQAMITGVCTYYPDRRLSQQIGIVPDLFVRRTLAGFLAGRDEVLVGGVSRDWAAVQIDASALSSRSLTSPPAQHAHLVIAKQPSS